MKEKTTTTITLINSQKHSPRPYKKRRRFTPEETQLLMDHFEKNPRPNSFHRTRLAMMIPGMTERGIQVWFQNRRAKAKLVSSGNNSSEGPSSPITREEEDEIDSRASSPQLNTSTSSITTPISNKSQPFWSATNSSTLHHPTSTSSTTSSSSPVSPSEAIDAKVICAAALQSLSQTAAALQSLSQVAASKPKTQMSINYLLS